MPKLEAKKEEEAEEVYDPEKPYEFKFKILAEYMELYQKLSKENPQYVQKEQNKIRKV